MQGLLRNKNILIIMPKFFGYDEFIKKELENMSASVEIIYENMDEVNWLYRAAYVYFPKYRDNLMQKYYEKKFKYFQKNFFDYVLVIRGESLLIESIKNLKTFQKKAYFIMYQWDSMNNNQNAKNIAGLFDKVLTFDMKDAEKYQWEYRPLFFCNKNMKQWKEKKYDFMYVCSLHSERVKMYRQLANIIKEYHLSGYLRVFSKWTRFFKQKYLKHNPAFTKIKVSQMNFKPLDLAQMQDLYADTKVVVDFTHPNQNGLTMRTIESIGAGCKLLTNNINIKRTSMYNPNNIYVYQNNFDNIAKDFWEKPYEPLEKEKYEYYSLRGWIKDVFEIIK